MSSKPKAGWGSYEFTRPAYEMQRATEIEHTKKNKNKHTTTNQKRKKRDKETTRPNEAHDYHLKHSVSEEFPGTRVQSFEALLFGLLSKLSVMLDNAAADVNRQRAKRDGWG